MTEYESEGEPFAIVVFPRTNARVGTGPCKIGILCNRALANELHESKWLEEIEDWCAEEKVELRVLKRTPRGEARLVIVCHSTFKLEARNKAQAIRAIISRHQIHVELKGMFSQMLGLALSPFAKRKP